MSKEAQEKEARATKVAVVKPSQLATVSPEVQSDGHFEGDVNDILIPKLLVGQAMSQAVQDQKVAPGQIYKSTTLEVVGTKDKPLSFIPLCTYKTWIISQKVGGRYQFKKIEPFNAENREQPWAWKEGDGSDWKREQCLNFYGLIPDDIKKDVAARKALLETGEIPDGDSGLLPCLLSFKSTSYKAGRSLSTHFALMADFKVHPFVQIIQLNTEKETNDLGSFHVFTVGAKKEKTPQEYLTTCKRWYDMVRQTSMKVDDSDLGTPEANIPKVEAF